MLDSFNEEQLLKFARLVKVDEDFKSFVKYLTDQVTQLALKSTRHGGEQGDTMRNASVALADLRDLLIQAPDVLQGNKERKEMNDLGIRDYISP